jgi:hypothetical protein
LEGELAQSQAEIAVLEKSQKEWTARSAKLLSKYNVRFFQSFFQTFHF